MIERLRCLISQAWERGVEVITAGGWVGGDDGEDLRETSDGAWYVTSNYENVEGGDIKITRGKMKECQRRNPTSQVWLKLRLSVWGAVRLEGHQEKNSVMLLRGPNSSVLAPASGTASDSERWRPTTNLREQQAAVTVYRTIGADTMGPRTAFDSLFRLSYSWVSEGGLGQECLTWVCHAHTHKHTQRKTTRTSSKMNQTIERGCIH